MNRVINSTKTLGNPDTNAQHLDEDGEGDEVGTENPDVNETPGPDDTDEEDDSPAVLSLTVSHNGKLTDINVRIATPTGAMNKRHVMPGHLTAMKLANAIRNVKDW